MSTEQRATRQLVVFTLGGEQYAVPIKQVQEIIRYTKLRSIASGDKWVRGVLSLRGKIVPVYDLSTRLTLDAHLTDQANIVILDTGAQIVGLIVEALDEVLTVEGEQLDEAPGADTTLIDAIAKVDDRLIVLINASAISSEHQHAA